MPNLGPTSKKPAPSRRMSLRVAASVGLVLGVVSLGALVLNLKEVDPRDATAAFGKRIRSHTWQLYRGHHWQIVATATAQETTEETDNREGNRGACPEGMIEIKGNMKMDPLPNATIDQNSIEEQQKTTCTKWINREFPERCAQFDREKWLEKSQKYSTKAMRFCIDRFEYPNLKGAYPIIMVNYTESESLCREQGKRLCNELEWTFACEGEEATPYPYGYARDSNKCIIDRQWKPYNGAAFSPREGEAAGDEMDKLWQGVPSGSQAQCKSVFGVYDQTGNVDEWTKSTRGDGPSILKGGYWGPVRTRCRPSTRSHDENHTFYQQGFRCCAAVPEPRRTDGEDPSIAPIPGELK